MIPCIARFAGLSEEALRPILGGLGAAASSAAIWIADASPNITPEAQGWVQLGGTIGLISFLVYACRTLWMALQDARNATTAALNSATVAATTAAANAASVVQAAEDRMATERAQFIAAKDALEREIRTDWKQQNDALMKVLNKLDPDTKP